MPCLRSGPGARFTTIRALGRSNPDGPHRRANALSRLLYGEIRKADDRERGQTGADVDLHLDRDRLDTDERRRLDGTLRHALLQHEGGAMMAQQRPVLGDDQQAR